MCSAPDTKSAIAGRRQRGERRRKAIPGVETRQMIKRSTRKMAHYMYAGTTDEMQ